MKTIVSGNIAAAVSIVTDKKGNEYLKFPLYEDKYVKNGDAIEKVQGKKTVYRVSVYDAKAKETAEKFEVGDKVEISGKFDAVVIGGKSYNMLRMYAGRVLFKKGEKAAAKAAPAAQAA